MKSLNAAEKIREFLGCYVPQLIKIPAPAKRKTVSYGENLRAHFARYRVRAA